MRPDPKLLYNVPGNSIRLELPHGSFNPGLARWGSDGYLLAYRANEARIKVCNLTHSLDVIPNSHLDINLGQFPVADPRLLWINNQQLLMVFSSLDCTHVSMENMRACIIYDESKTPAFNVNPTQHLISPRDSRLRQKNWMPFLHAGEVYLIASTCPHVIFRLDPVTMKSEKVYVTEWLHPFWPGRGEFLRGNANAVPLADGNYLGTFHTAVHTGKPPLYYDNGCYVFEGRAPFRPLRCSNKTYLAAEAACEPHFRKAGIIVNPFPCGMCRDGDCLRIAYGDNDSACKILETTVDEMLKTTVTVYSF